uniref:Uncharacterized protein n=1 Tax=Yoonia rhodophyticola TaxID=3137370 RepID=A0AAN0NJX5_9RHOB
MAGFANAAQSPANGLTAAFASDNDVVLTIAADAVPADAHVRVYPRQFMLIEAIGAAPSFLRGNGGAGIAAAGQPLDILLADPLGLGAGAPPSPARVTVDIVVTPGWARADYSAILWLRSPGTGPLRRSTRLRPG